MLVRIQVGRLQLPSDNVAMDLQPDLTDPLDQSLQRRFHVRTAPVDRDGRLDRVLDQLVAETVGIDRGGTIANDSLQQPIYLFDLRLSDEVLGRQAVHPHAVQVEVLNHSTKGWLGVNARGFEVSEYAKLTYTKVRNLPQCSCRKPVSVPPVEVSREPYRTGSVFYGIL